RAGVGVRERTCRGDVGRGGAADRRRIARQRGQPQRGGGAARHQRPHAALQAREAARDRLRRAGRPRHEAGMSDVGIDRMLAEMRRLAAQAESPGTAAPSEAEGRPFAELLEASIQQVSAAQSSASEMAAAFEQGTGDVSLPEVMIALQKASLSFQAMTEVRNRLVTAYQEVMNMPV